MLPALRVTLSCLPACRWRALTKNLNSSNYLKPSRASSFCGRAITLMSAIGPKRTSVVALHMSAFGGKADMNRFYRCPQDYGSILVDKNLLGGLGVMPACKHPNAGDAKVQVRALA